MYIVGRGGREEEISLLIILDKVLIEGQSGEEKRVLKLRRMCLKEMRMSGKIGGKYDIFTVRHLVNSYYEH